jgi:hypothetical protein
MKVGAAMAIVCSLLARCVLASEPLESALARAHGRWTRLSTSRETTVLASDRGVTALVAQVSQARALIAIAQARAQELAAARRVLGSIADEDFTADGARRHHARVGQLEAEMRASTARSVTCGAASSGSSTRCRWRSRPAAPMVARQRSVRS